jgi:hypothetical protein
MLSTYEAIISLQLPGLWNTWAPVLHCALQLSQQTVLCCAAVQSVPLCCHAAPHIASC